MKYAGITILVIEDEPIISFELETNLADNGAKVLAATDVVEGLILSAQADMTAAILDVQLKDDDCGEICRQLHRRQIPFVFHTATYRSPVVADWPDVPVVGKPASFADIAAALDARLGAASSTP